MNIDGSDYVAFMLLLGLTAYFAKRFFWWLGDF